MTAPDDDRPADWAELIGSSITLRQQLGELQPELSPFTAPHMAATDEQLLAVENRLGATLDKQHTDLLRHVNGWPLFFTYADLLGTDEIASGKLWSRAQELLDLFFSEAPIPQGIPARDELVPVAVSELVTDVFVLWRTGPETHGGRPILWLAGEEVDRWANTREWLLSVNQYLRDDIAELSPS